jgi:hypothetical protein
MKLNEVVSQVGAGTGNKRGSSFTLAKGGSTVHRYYGLFGGSGLDLCIR